MRTPLRFGLFALAVAASLSLTGEGGAADTLVMSGTARSPVSPPGGQITYDVRVSSSADLTGQTAVLSATLPAGANYVAGSTSVNGTVAADPTTTGSTVRWTGLPAPGMQQNRYGVHTMIQDIMDGSHIQAQLDWARALGGPRGYVKQLLYPITASTPGPQRSWIEFVSEAHARDLTPVLRLQGVYNAKAGRWEKPQADPDGSYTSIAAAFRRVVAQLPRREGRRLYVEIWNEPNLHYEWSGASDPAEYARFLLETSQAIRSLGNPRIVILNGGLAPGGNYSHLDFIDAMFQAVPAAASAFDVWSSHPYAGNRPPSYNGDYYSIRGYQLELSRVARYRDISNLKVMGTEAGYSLGNHEDPRYPPIDEANRAAYTREAFESYWNKDSTLLAVMPFQLSAPFDDWPAFDWVYPSSGTRSDGSPSQAHAVFDTIKALPKPSTELVITFRLTAPSSEGTFQPNLLLSAGSLTAQSRAEAVTVTRLDQAGVISGQILLPGRSSGGGVTVSVGPYTATTGPDGSYQLAVPPGSHTVFVARPGYLGARREQVPVVVNARTALPAVKLTAGNVVPEPSGSGQPERIDVQDLAAVGAVINTTPPANPTTDVNGDGTVNVFDLVAVGANLGRSEPGPW